MALRPHDPSHPLSAPSGLPPRIRTDESNAFAHHTMAVRVPAILDGVLRDNPDYPEHVQGRVRELKRAMQRGEPFPALDAAAPHAGSWLRELERRRGEGWLSSDWFFAENYAYRCLADATEFWCTGRDPFAPDKLAEYASAAHRAALESAASIRGGRGETLERLLLASVFGNRMDLSFAASRERGTRASGADLLADDSSLARERLERGSGPVHVIIDNAGTELSVDLVLAARVIDLAGADLVLHVKVHPAFVSDAIESDVRWFIEAYDERAAALWGQCDAAARACREVLRHALYHGHLRIAPHPFWNGPLSLWQLPSELARELAGARLVILKGDAHYRRAVGDALWDPEKPFSEVTDYFPAPLLALRTLKSDTIVGLPAGAAARLDAEDSSWRVNGRRGVACLGGRG